MKHFEIENYRPIKDNELLVYIVRGKLSMPITIPKEQFEFWLMIAQRLVTKMILHDPKEGDRLVDGIMSKEEYWSLPDKEIHEDLYSYITTHPMIYRGQVYNNPLVSINWGFNNHRATLN